MQRTLNLICWGEVFFLMRVAVTKAKSANYSFGSKIFQHRSSHGQSQNISSIHRFPLLSNPPNHDVGRHVQEASLRRQISMKFLMSETSRGILAVFV